MSNPTLVPGSDRLEVLSLTADQGTIILTARTGGDTAQCPICGQLSTRVHSRYRRTLADLPWQEIPARLMLWSRRFFCDTASCPRRIFTERLPGIVAPHARRTDRLGDWLRHIAFALGGEPGARLLRQLGVTVCGDTLLARIRADLSPAQPTPRVLSVDDFAFRRGRTYGSILVDLERHRVVDLLPDRSGGGLATWLRAHPGVHIISRDRSGEYADGARLGAPQALQVADRFHLLRNLRDVVLRVFKRHTHLSTAGPTARIRRSARDPVALGPRGLARADAYHDARALRHHPALGPRGDEHLGHCARPQAAPAYRPEVSRLHGAATATTYGPPAKHAHAAPGLSPRTLDERLP